MPPAGAGGVSLIMPGIINNMTGLIIIITAAIYQRLKQKK